MLASIITPEDIKSANASLAITIGILALLPLLRLKGYSSSAIFSLIIYAFICLWSWFWNSDAKSSACPEYSAYLWPLYASLLGIIYLIAHTPFKITSWIPLLGIGILFMSMVLLSDWTVINKVIDAYIIT